MKTVKTTFEIPQRVHTRLKAMAGRLGINARELVVEGLELVLGRYEATGERDELLARAQAARKRIREGAFDGPYDLSETYEGLMMVAESRPKYGPGEDDK